MSNDTPQGRIDWKKIANEAEAEVSRLTAELAEANRKHVECVTINERLLSDIRCAKAEISELRAQEPVYQLKLADGSWIDQAAHSYEYNMKNGVVEVRKLYAHPVPAAPAVPEWWPMATAPRDGTRVLLKGYGNKFVAGFEQGAWYIVNDCHIFDSDCEGWMPLTGMTAAPQPPASDDALLFAAEAKRSGQ